MRTNIQTFLNTNRIYSGEKIVSSISGPEKTGQLYVKRMKLEHFLTPYIKISLNTITQSVSEQAKKTSLREKAAL